MSALPIWDGDCTDPHVFEKSARDHDPDICVCGRFRDDKLHQSTPSGLRVGDKPGVGAGRCTKNAPETAGTLYTAINHERVPHCIGCWTVQLNGAIGEQWMKLVCNECGDVRHFNPETLSAWRCGANIATGANDPQDWDWPLCGCDPYADKVIATLNESGLYVVPCEPTIAMIEAAKADEVNGHLPAEIYEDIYVAMVERSQKP